MVHEIEVYIGALVITASLMLAWVYYARSLTLSKQNRNLCDTIVHTTMSTLPAVLEHESDLNKGLDYLVSTVNELLLADGIIVLQEKDCLKIIAESYSDPNLKDFLVSHTLENSAVLQASLSKGMRVLHSMIGGDEHLNTIVLSETSNDGRIIVVAHIIGDTAVSVDELGQYVNKLLHHLNHLVIMALELSKQRAINEIIAQKQESDKRSIELAERLDKELKYKELQNELISMASHEFRTPLAVISSSIYIVQRQIKALYEGWHKLVKAGDDQQAIQELIGQEAQEVHEQSYQKSVQLINTINAYVNHMSSMINSLLKMIMMDERGVQNSKESVDIGESTKSIIGKLQDLRSDVKVKFKNEVPGKMVWFDSGNLQHVLTNLISNAIKYSKPNTEVGIMLQQSAPSAIKLIVSDHGIGIPKKQMNKLFSKFFRGNNTTGITGIGVGLYVTKKLLLLNHAEIDVESKEQVGTTFTVTFAQADISQVTLNEKGGEDVTEIAS